jgi:hypothetical protein
MQILHDPRFDADEEEVGYPDTIFKLRSTEGWENLRENIFRLLLDPAYQLFWHHLVTVLWYAVNDKCELPPDYTIALLYTCLERDERIDGNLVWSITIQLKRIPYSSDYDPYQDDAVQIQKQKIQLEKSKVMER